MRGARRRRRGSWRGRSARRRANPGLAGPAAALPGPRRQAEALAVWIDLRREPGPVLPASGSTSSPQVAPVCEGRSPVAVRHLPRAPTLALSRSRSSIDRSMTYLAIPATTESWVLPQGKGAESRGPGGRLLGAPTWGTPPDWKRSLIRRVSQGFDGPLTHPE
jgi:hypothetical protein